MRRRFQQIDVFSRQAFKGNPLALVLDSDGLGDLEMASMARWTNLSETAFLLPTTHPEADYRVRIWTPRVELPFAGHPTLGSCHGWLSMGMAPRHPGYVVQECGIGLVRIRNDGQRLAFAAPPLIRSGPIPEAELDGMIRALGLQPEQVLDHQIIDNGGGWVGLLLDNARSVLAIKPDPVALAPYKVGVIGAYRSGDRAAAGVDDAAFEVRAFAPAGGTLEDPVTGSLNAGLASWMIGQGLITQQLSYGPDASSTIAYVVSQGTRLGRRGRLFIEQVGQTIWIGGHTTTTIEGTLDC